MDLETGLRFADGALVVVLDDGPAPRPAMLAVAAAAVTPEAMSRLVRHTSGYVTVGLPATRCDELGLPCLVHDPRSSSRAVPGVSVDARVGVGTGISATDRALTARLLADADTVPTDLCRPGHVVPMRVPLHAVRGVDPAGRQLFAALDLCAHLGQPLAVVTSALIGRSGDTMGEREAREFAAAQRYPVLGSSSVPVAAVTGRAVLAEQAS